MSYIEQNSAFSSGIQELADTEIDFISGGFLPLIPIAYAGIALSATVLVAGYAWVAGATTGYAANKE